MNTATVAQVDWLKFPGATYCAPARYGDGDPWPRRYGNWDDCKDGPFMVHSYTSGSDYSGNLVEVSNRDSFREQFAEGEDEWWCEVSGGHATFAIVVDITKAPDEAYEFYSALDDYPLADEDAHYALQCEAESEAWDNWACRDFIRMVEKSTGLDWAPEDEQVRELFHEAAEKANVYWENQTGSDMWIDIKRVVAKVDRVDVLATGGRETDEP